jgi:hypothetical protein
MVRSEILSDLFFDMIWRSMARTISSLFERLVLRRRVCLHLVLMMDMSSWICGQGIVLMEGSEWQLGYLLRGN